MHPPGSAIFKIVFDAYNFSIISNLFDSDKPYALRMRKLKCANKMYHIFGDAFRTKVKKFNPNLPENYLKSTKIPIMACKFSKNFWGSMTPDPLRAFLVFQSASK